MKMSKLGDFEVLGEIGKGGFGTVYKVKNKLGNILALKVIKDNVAGAISEPRIQAQLKNSHIVQVYKYHPDIKAIEMEYMPGGNLADILKKGKLSYTKAIPITSDILKALCQIHALEYIHRDIKPANVLFTADGTAKLSDFGLAKLIDEEIRIMPQQIKTSILINTLSQDSYSNTQSKIKGTLPYMAPEQIKGLSNQQSDIYSVGLVLYEMLTGKLPEGIFPKLPSELNEDVPKKSDLFFKKTLCELKFRYATSREMLKDILDHDDLISRISLISDPTNNLNTINHSNTWQYWANLARECACQSNYDGLVANYCKALNTDPYNIEVYLAFSNECKVLNLRNREAIAALTIALEECRLSRSQRQILLEERAHHNRFIGEYNKAFNDLKEIIGFPIIGWVLDKLSNAGKNRKSIKEKINRMRPAL